MCPVSVCDLVNIFNSNSTQTHRGDTNIKHLVYILAHSQYNNGKLMLSKVNVQLVMVQWVQEGP